MRIIGRTKSATLGMAFLVLSLASVSVSMKAAGLDLSARGEALLSAWEEVAGLFAFGYHPVSATELAALGSPVESLCPEFDLPGRESLAFSHSIEKRDEPVARAEVSSTGNDPCKKRCNPVVAAAKRESSTRSKVVALRLPVKRIDVAEVIRVAYASRVEELSHTDGRARYRFDLRWALQPSKAAGRANNVLRFVPAFLVEPQVGPQAERRIETVRRQRPLKSYAPPASAVKKCES